MRNTNETWPLVEAKREDFFSLSDRIWGMPELNYNEHRSSAEHAAMLEEQGFRVTRDAGGLPTAVIGEAGEDGPVIAILGEFDALPGLSQEAGVAEKRALEQGGNGHACGHNLLGSASMLAAAAVKDYLAASGIKGRVRYYGLPGGGRRLGQGVHGAGRAVRGCGCRDFLASGADRGGEPGHFARLQRD